MVTVLSQLCPSPNNYQNNFSNKIWSLSLLSIFSWLFLGTPHCFREPSRYHLLKTFITTLCSYQLHHSQLPHCVLLLSCIETLLKAEGHTSQSLYIHTCGPTFCPETPSPLSLPNFPTHLPLRSNNTSFILLGHKKEDFKVCSSMNGPGEH